MSYQRLEDEEVHSSEDDELEGLQREMRGAPATSQPLGTRSLYALSKSEVTRNIANRFVHSRTYVILYLAMASLSTTTVILSLQDGCPGLVFYILEIIINVAMIVEVTIRFVAFGKQFWKSPYNVVDLGLTFLCVLTLLVILFAGCGATSKEEELLDTLLLVARNVLQFGRLATVMRRSGRSIFSRPRAIDLSAARTSRLDIDLDDEEAQIGISNGSGNDVEFDAGAEPETQQPRQGVGRGAVIVHQPEEDEADVWARLG